MIDERGKFKQPQNLHLLQVQQAHAPTVIQFSRTSDTESDPAPSPDPTTSYFSFVNYRLLKDYIKFVQVFSLPQNIQYLLHDKQLTIACLLTPLNPFRHTPKFSCIGCTLIFVPPLTQKTARDSAFASLLTV